MKTITMKSDLPMSNKNTTNSNNNISPELSAFTDTPMPPVREDLKNTSRQESLTESLEETVLQASLESSLPYNTETQQACLLEESDQDHVMTNENPDAAASCNPSRPKVTPETTKENCNICGSVEDNVKTNFSYLKKDLCSPEEVIDFLIEKKCFSDNEVEDVRWETKRRRKVDVLLKKLLGACNGQEACQCLIDAFSTIHGFQFIPPKMHKRHTERSRINVITYAIKSSHLNDEHDYLVENIEPEETADLLLEEYVISHLDHEEIVNPQFHKSRRTMTKEMIKILLDKDQDALNLFLFVLEHTDNGRNGNVAQKLKSISGKEKQKTGFFGISKKKDKSIQIQTTDKAKEAVECMSSTNVSLKLSFTDKKCNALTALEGQVLSILRQKKDIMDDLADAFAKLSIQDFEKGSIVIHLQLESVQYVNRFRYAVANGEVETFVNRLLESADIHRLIPKGGLNVEVDVCINEEEDGGSSDQVKEWSSAQKCIVQNMAYLLEELNPTPILKEYRKRKFLSDTDIDSIIQNRKGRRLQVQALLKIILSKDDSDVDNFFSILQSGNQLHIFERIRSPRCAECIKVKIEQCREILVEELDSITIRDTLDRCKNVPYELYSDPGNQRKQRNNNFLNLLKESADSLLIFDDVLFSAGLYSLLECESSADIGDHVCSKGHAKENNETKDKYQRIIEENKDKLANYFKASEIVLTLVERGALTFQDKYLILNESTVYKSNMSLLDIITKKGSNSCSKFADVLQEQSSDKTVYELFEVEYAGGGWIDEKVNSKPKEHVPEQLPLEPPVECSPIKVVAAIDFGTTFSGFAYSFIGQTSIAKIQTKKWGASKTSSLVSLKTPSCLLLKTDKSFEAFGFKADEKYSDLAEDEEHHHWHYFKQFKMLLHNKSDLRRDTKIKDDQGHELNALDIFSHSIKYLKDALLQHINKTSEGKDILERDITWVLTVPAIWDEPAKQFMREAAHQAGILPNRLTLALEPEAAAIYVKHINISRQEEGASSPELTTFKPGTKFVVLDVGGGTVDATITEISEDNKLQHLHEASGGEWGGQKVNEAIHSLFEEVFGSETMEKFKSEYRSDHFDLDLAIETSKRMVESATATTLDIVFSCNLMNAFKSLNVDINVPIIPDKYIGKVAVRGQRLRIDRGLFKELFRPCIENIIKHAKSILSVEKSKGVEYLICVGGFSECDYLQQELRDNFPKLRVIIPTDAGLAVLKGAVLYGQTPGIVKSRICPFSYGTSVHRFFLKGHDDESKRVMHHGEPYCKDVFHKVAEAGCSYSVGDKGETEIHPMTADMTKMSVKIYRSTNKNPRYVTDEDCLYLGRMVVDMPDTQGGLNRAVVVSMTFGETELMVEGLDKTSKKKVHVSLDLLSSGN